MSCNISLEEIMGCSTIQKFYSAISQKITMWIGISLRCFTFNILIVPQFFAMHDDVDDDAPFIVQNVIQKKSFYYNSYNNNVMVHLT